MFICVYIYVYTYMCIKTTQKRRKRSNSSGLEGGAYMCTVNMCAYIHIERERCIYLNISNKIHNNDNNNIIHTYHRVLVTCAELLTTASLPALLKYDSGRMPKQVLGGHVYHVSTHTPRWLQCLVCGFRAPPSVMTPPRLKTLENDHSAPSPAVASDTAR